MNDCSTNSMKPKEQPKTCGNCAHYFNVRPLMRQGMCPLDELDANGCAPIHNECDQACWKWAVKPLTFKQRCQQLEQLTRRLYRYIKQDADESWSPAKETAAKYYREEIEALGVSLDD